MSLLCMPKLVKRRLEQVQRDFLGGGGPLDKKPHLVRGQIVCYDKLNDGLGFKHLFELNRALLCKWLWQFVANFVVFASYLCRSC